MSHEPPIPPGNQSPFPIAEAPHEHPAPLPPVIKPTSAAPRALLIGGAIAAAGVAVVGGLAGFLFSRAKPKRGRRKA